MIAGKYTESFECIYTTLMSQVCMRLNKQLNTTDYERKTKDSCIVETTFDGGVSHKQLTDVKLP